VEVPDKFIIECGEPMIRYQRSCYHVISSNALRIGGTVPDCGLGTKASVRRLQGHASRATMGFYKYLEELSKRKQSDVMR
jgi:hypothetical protein